MKVNIHIPFKGARLKLEQRNIEGDMDIDFHHPKESGLRIVNSGEDTILTIYHPSGAEIKIDEKGNISVFSPQSIKMQSALDITLEAGNVDIFSQVKIVGNLEVTGTVNAPLGYEANSSGMWHFPE